MSASTEPQLAVLGAGHLAAALVEGLVLSGYPPQHICVCAPSEANRGRLQASFAIRTTPDNRRAALSAQLCILAVRPPQVEAALAPLADGFADKTLISTAAGLTRAALTRLLPAAHIIRSMPNLGIARGCGFTGLCAPATQVPRATAAEAEALFARLGTVAWVEESLLDAVTALAGSGPGFAFHFADALTQGGTALGLEREQARQMALSVFQACAGLLASDADAAAWQRKVASAGGTTEAGLQQLTAGGLTELIGKALLAARNQAAALNPPTED